MEGLQLERKRPALSTVGRGSRGLTGLWDRPTPVLFSGTAIAQTGNRLQMLKFDRDANELNVEFAISSPAETWSLDVLEDYGEVTKLIAATRRGEQSSVEVWGLEGVTDLISELPGENEPSLSNAGPFRIESLVSTPIDGYAFQMRRNPFAANKYVVLTNDGGSLMDASESLKAPRNLATGDDRTERETTPGRVVGGDWIDGETVVLAFRDALGIYDVRTGTTQGIIEMKAAFTKGSKDVVDDWISPNPGRLSAVCSDRTNYLYTGGRDGFVRVIDVRRREIVWQVEHSRQHWLTGLECSENVIFSGGTDGVVRCWNKEGKPAGTFPQHDDTVTNLCCSSEAFASVSYEGRIGVNAVPAVS